MSSVAWDKFVVDMVKAGWKVRRNAFGDVEAEQAVQGRIYTITFSFETITSSNIDLVEYANAKMVHDFKEWANQGRKKG